MKLHALLAVGLLGLPLLGQLHAEVPDYKLSDFELGTQVAGDEIDLSKLEGRVIAIEYWGPR